MRTEVQGCISPDHPSLAGHFPGNPVVPGVVILTEVLRAIEQHLGVTLGKLTFPSVKFTAPLRPGHPFIVALEPATGLVSFAVTCGDTRIATGVFRQVDPVAEHGAP